MFASPFSHYPEDGLCARHYILAKTFNQDDSFSENSTSDIVIEDFRGGNPWFPASIIQLVQNIFRKREKCPIQTQSNDHFSAPCDAHPVSTDLSDVTRNPHNGRNTAEKEKESSAEHAHSLVQPSRCEDIVLHSSKVSVCTSDDPPRLHSTSRASTLSNLDCRNLQQAPRKRFRRALQISHRTPCLSVNSAVLSTKAVTALHANIPCRHYIRDWQQMFSTMHDGASMRTLYSRCQQVRTDGFILCIRDDRGSVFGCYTSKPWQTSRRYYGSGETFVFSDDGEKTKVYPWTRSNNYFQLSSSSSIALGGGPGGFALFVDEMLEFGTSRDCATFNNPCLASSQQFYIVVLEVYALVPAYRFVQGRSGLK